MTLPNFIGIGAPRAGSTWLDHQLRAHPEVYLPAQRKELMFFDRHFARGTSWYESWFDVRSEHAVKAIGEISPRYFANPSVPERIRDSLSSCQFLLILRNPMDRSYSEYKYRVQAYNEKREFMSFISEEEAVRDESLYDVHLQRWFDVFTADRFLIIIFEEAISRPQETFDRLADFLRIGRSNFDSASGSLPVNPSFLPRWKHAYTLAKRASRFCRHQNLDRVVNLAVRLGARRFFLSEKQLPPLDQEVRCRLAPRFRDSIRRLEDIADCDLSVWGIR